MIVLIDGYNLLKQIFPKQKNQLFKQREELIKQLGFYKRLRPDIKELIIVFDGGVFSHATREIHRGVVVIFSGNRQSADDWILQHIHKNKGKEFLLITLDHNLILKAEELGVASMSVFDFYALLKNCIEDEALGSMIDKKKIGPLVKYEEKDNFEELHSEALDLLMDEATLNSYELEKKLKEDEEENDSFLRKRKLKKRERFLLKKIKKL